MRNIFKKKCENCNDFFKATYKSHLKRRKFCSISCSISFSNITRKPETFELWKGDKVGYRALHDWVEKLLGKPTICQECLEEKLPLKSGRRRIQWANLSHKYKRDIQDWKAMCVPCHMKYDHT